MTHDSLSAHDPSPQSSDAELPPDAIDRYIAGASPADEATRARAYLDTQPGIAAFHQTLHRMLGHASVPEAATSFAGMWTRLTSQSYRETSYRETSYRETSYRETSYRETSYRETSQRRRATRWITPMRASATALLLFVGVALFRIPHVSHPTQQYQTAPGQRLAVQLEGGSRMLLGPATTAQVTSDAITIHGEAYFDVMPRADRPLTVRTANTTVHVLGTKFVVRQYPGESQSRVIVEDGRVALQHRLHSAMSGQTVLSAHMMAQVTDSGATVTSGIALRDYTGWTRGLLVFDKAPLRDVIAELARSYGVVIQITDTALAKQRIGLEVSVTEQPVSQVLELIGEAANAHCAVKNQTYLLAPGRSTTATPAHELPRQRFPQPEKQYGR